MTETPPAASEGDPLEHFLCFSVYAAGLAFNRVYKPLLDRFGITYPQYLALVALRDGNGRTVSELGGKLYLESNTLTPLIKRLEAGGFVTRTRDKQDERVVRVALTDAGRTTVDDALGCIPAAIMEATGMQNEDLKALNASLASLGSALRSSAAPSAAPAP